MPRKEESLIEEMRAAIARDREQLSRRASPLLETPAESAPEPELEPGPEQRPSLLGRLFGRGSGS